MKCNTCFCRCARRGFSVTEMIIAIMLTIAAMAGVAQLMARAARQYRVLDERTVAARAVANAMETLMTRPWTDIAAADAKSLPVPKAVSDALHDVKLEVHISRSDEEPDAGARKIQVGIQWTAPSGRPAAPVKLTAWRFPHKENRP